MRALLIIALLVSASASYAGSAASSDCPSCNGGAR